jgi:hypothetical protein
LRRDKNTYDSVANARLDVRIHGSSAVIVGTTKQRGKDAAGKPFSYTYRWTDTGSSATARGSASPRSRFASRGKFPSLPVGVPAGQQTFGYWILKATLALLPSATTDIM